MERDINNNKPGDEKDILTSLATKAGNFATNLDRPGWVIEHYPQDAKALGISNPSLETHLDLVLDPNSRLNRVKNEYSRLAETYNDQLETGKTPLTVWKQYRQQRIEQDELKLRALREPFIEPKQAENQGDKQEIKGNNSTIPIFPSRLEALNYFLDHLHDPDASVAEIIKILGPSVKTGRPLLWQQAYGSLRAVMGILIRRAIRNTSSPEEQAVNQRIRESINPEPGLGVLKTNWKVLETWFRQHKDNPYQSEPQDLTEITPERPQAFTKKQAQILGKMLQMTNGAVVRLDKETSFEYKLDEARLDLIQKIASEQIDLEAGNIQHDRQETLDKLRNILRGEEIYSALAEQTNENVIEFLIWLYDHNEQNWGGQFIEFLSAPHVLKHTVDKYDRVQKSWLEITLPPEIGQQVKSALKAKEDRQSAIRKPVINLTEGPVLEKQEVSPSLIPTETQDLPQEEESNETTAESVDLKDPLANSPAEAISPNDKTSQPSKLSAKVENNPDMDSLLREQDSDFEQHITETAGFVASLPVDQFSKGTLWVYTQIGERTLIDLFNKRLIRKFGKNTRFSRLDLMVISYFVNHFKYQANLDRDILRTTLEKAFRDKVAQLKREQNQPGR